LTPLPRRLFVLPALLAVCILGAASALAAPSFILGVLPVHSARVLTERYEPLRGYLEKNLQQPVRIESAANFRRFHERMLQGDFDLSIAPSHFARVAQKDAGFLPLTQFSPDHDALLVYAAARPLDNIKALKNQRLAVIDRLAVTVTASLQYIASQGLEAERDFQVVEHRTHASAAHALISGLADAAVTTSQGILQMPDDVQRKLVVMKHIADIPAFVMMAKPGTDKARSEQLKRLLLNFPREAEGIDFLGQTGYSSVIPISEANLKRGDIFLKETRKALK
jgi:phosphonate transport system substrate-binding protein